MKPRQTARCSQKAPSRPHLGSRVPGHSCRAERPERLSCSAGLRTRCPRRWNICGEQTILLPVDSCVEHWLSKCLRSPDPPGLPRLQHQAHVERPAPASLCFLARLHGLNLFPMRSSQNWWPLNREQAQSKVPPPAASKQQQCLRCKGWTAKLFDCCVAVRQAALAHKGPAIDNTISFFPGCLAFSRCSERTGSEDVQTDACQLKSWLLQLPQAVFTFEAAASKGVKRRSRCTKRIWLAELRALKVSKPASPRNSQASLSLAVG